LGQHGRRRDRRPGAGPADEPRDRACRQPVCQYLRDRAADGGAAGQAGRHFRREESAAGMTVTRRGAATAFGILAVFTFPLWTPNLYLLHVATLIGAYWVLIAGLNLVVGYAGALSIG